MCSQNAGGGGVTLGVSRGCKTQLALFGVYKGVAHPAVYTRGPDLSSLQGAEEAVPPILCV